MLGSRRRLSLTALRSSPTTSSTSRVSQGSRSGAFPRSPRPLLLEIEQQLRPRFLGRFRCRSLWRGGLEGRAEAREGSERGEGWAVRAPLRGGRRGRRLRDGLGRGLDRLDRGGRLVAGQRGKVHEAAEALEIRQAGLAVAGGAELIDLRVEVVDEVERERLGGHRLDRRGVLLLALVREDEVLEVQAQVVGEVGDRGAALAQEVAAEDDVADEAADERVV